MKYRRDIDGLRGLAVLVVLLFHFQVPGFAGGFVGVDVFFVISGYLITKLIKTEIDETGRFRFGNFYLRRIRRLFPAAFVTIVASGILSTILFTPYHMQRFGGEVLSALFSVSNIYFWLESGYFDSDAIFKPLLHTWSLSVEEQFYLIWPAIIVITLTLWGSRGAVILLAGVFSLSLVLAEIYNVESAAAAFYLSPFRAFEFAIGAILVWLPERIRDLRWTGAALPLGIAVIVLSVLLIDHSTPFPGVAALFPCVGAALCIVGGERSFFAPMLTNRIAVGTGLISYSLYLVHWPLAVFYAYVTEPHFSLLDALGLLTVSLGLAAVMHRFIEEPFRRRQITLHRPMIKRVAISGFALVFALIPSLAAHAYLTDGWTWRVSSDLRQLVASASLSNAEITGECRYRSRNFDDELRTKFETCVSAHGPAVLIIGDSHGTDLFNALAFNAKREHVVGVTQGGCRIYQNLEKCQYAEAADFLTENRMNVDAVIYTQTGDYFIADRDDDPVILGLIYRTKEYLEALADDGLRVVWAGPQWEPNIDLETAVWSRDWIERRLPELMEPLTEDVDAAIAAALADSSVAYLSKTGLLGAFTLNDFIIDGNATYSNADHWSAYGEQIFGARLIERSTLLSELMHQ